MNATARNSASATAWRRVAAHGVAAAAVAVTLAATALPARATTIQRVTSAGGIEAWLVQEPAVPLIAVDFAFEGGSAQDPEGKGGTANLAASLLDEGAGDLDSKAFTDRLERNAIEMSFYAGHDSLNGAMRTLTQNRDEAFDLLRLALTAPRFDSADVELNRAQIMAMLRKATTSPSDIASRRWWETAFAGHPYGRPVSGSLETVPQITAEDLKTYTHRVLARQNLRIAVVGDIDPATLKPLLDRVFGGLPVKPELTPVADVVPQALGREIDVRLDVPQTVIDFGGPGIARKDPDFMAAYLVNHILGSGSSDSRLYRDVREKRGLVYSVSNNLLWLDHAAIFIGGTATRANRAGETVALIEKKIRQFADDGPTAAELAEAKNYIKSSFALSLDTSGKIASLLVQLQRDRLGIDYFQKRAAMIDAVTLADARRVSKRLFGNGLMVTSVGEPEGVASADASAGQASPGRPARPPAALPIPGNSELR
ncbi:MAG TPA: pitrilysin family protein [Xanthobacteraceae bacterium]|nr:pitrilysin family protein [Xanthobacteraceae bacterium]